MTTKPTISGRAAEIAEKLDSGSWECFASVELERGGLVRTYRSKRDPRLTACLSKHTRLSPTVVSYRFADCTLTMAEACIPPLIGPLGQVFGAIGDAAAAIVEHDDMLARLRAPARGDAPCAA